MPRPPRPPNICPGPPGPLGPLGPPGPIHTFYKCFINNDITCESPNVVYDLYKKNIKKIKKVKCE